MIEIVRNLALRLLKIPPDPTPPAGSHASVRVFRAARNYYRLLLVKWGLKQVVVITGAVVSLFVLRRWMAQWDSRVVFWVEVAEWFGILSIFAQMPLTLALVRFDFELRWYIVTDRSLRIRAGIWDIREMTMTFANIQQITVEQGPLQRLLGLADVQVRTAGGGSGELEQARQRSQHTLMHLGFFHGVDNAGEIRDLILERMRKLRDTGLGDPDEVDKLEPGAAVRGDSNAQRDLLKAAHEFVQETHALRATMTLS
jgi:membrane protein YdbS with pleckstrin-like domain